MKGNVVDLLVVVDVSKSFTAVMSFFNFSRKKFLPRLKRNLIYYSSTLLSINDYCELLIF